MHSILYNKAWNSLWYGFPSHFISKLTARANLKDLPFTFYLFSGTLIACANPKWMIVVPSSLPLVHIMCMIWQYCQRPYKLLLRFNLLQNGCDISVSIRNESISQASTCSTVIALTFTTKLTQSLKSLSIHLNRCPFLF